MPAKKSAPRRKRAAPATSGPKKKQTVAAKKKHVRELAKAGQWVEIEKLYGKKILAEAKNYAAKNGVAKTPQQIAHEILLKNGYLPSTTQSAAVASTTLASSRRTGSISRKNMALTESTPRNSMPTNSPEILSKEQQELIEKRRKEALERRKRAQHPIQPPAVIRSFPSDATRRALQPTVDSELPTQQQQRCSSLGSIRHLVQSCKNTRRVVTPDTLPAKNPKVEKEQVRPEYFWDDLEAAAEIVQWENEHMAEAAMKQPTPEVAGSFQRQSSPKQNAFEQQILAGETEAQLPGSSVIPSISQEIAAAAEIIQWENEHESPAGWRNECNETATPFDRCSNNSDMQDTPQFQLLAPQTSSHQNQQIIQQPNMHAHRKRALEAASLPASTASAVSCKETNARKADPSHSVTPAHNQTDPTTEFINKHLVEDKMELPVLEFLNMMLA